MFNAEIWRGVIGRVKAQFDAERKPRHTALFYSTDMDQYLDADNPVDEPTTTIRQELRELGITRFVRIPEDSGMENYLRVEHVGAIDDDSWRR